MAITNQLTKQVDLPVWEWLRFAPTTTTALTALCTNPDGTERYLFYFSSTTLYKYDTWGDTWYVLSSVATPTTALDVKYVKNQGYQGQVLVSGSIGANQLRIGGIGTRNMVGMKIQIVSGTGAGQEKTITACSDDIIHDIGLCTSASTSVLTDTLKKWKQNQWVGYGLRINFNGGQFQSRQILYNTETAATINDTNYEGRNFLMAAYNGSSPYGAPTNSAGSQTGFSVTSQIVTVDSNWAVPPDATSKFKILSGGIWWFSRSSSSPYFNFVYYDILTDNAVTKLNPTGLFTAVLTGDFTIAPLSEKLLGNLLTATATSATARTIVTSTANMIPLAYMECDVIITSGTGVGQRRRIISNSATTLTIAVPWTTIPDATSIYSVTASDDIYWSGNNQARMLKYSPRANMWAMGNISDYGICSNSVFTRSGSRLPHSFSSATRGTNGVTAVNTTPVAGGTGYSIGDLLTLNTVGNTARVYVEAVNNVGAVTLVSLYTCGAGYGTGTSTTTGGTGSGCTISITSVGVIGVVTTNIAHDIQIGESVTCFGIVEAAWNTTYTVIGLQSSSIFEVVTTATASAASVFPQATNLLVDSSKNWTPNEHVGKTLLLQNNSYTGNITARKIIGNSSTTISFIAGTTPSNGTTRYAIQEGEGFGKDYQYYADQQLSQGYATTGAASTINDTSKAWLANAFSGQKVEVINPDGTRMEDIIRSNSATSLSLGRIVAGGSGTNTLAYSDDGGVTWTGLGTSIFSTQCNGVCWSGTRFVAVGSGTNTIAYSNDGVNWIGLGTTVISVAAYGVCWNGNKFVAVGNGTSSISYSYDGITWGSSTNVFNTGSATGYAVAWNGTRFVAMGTATGVTNAYSTDGISWTTGNFFTGAATPTGFGVCWAPTLNAGAGFFIAVGNGTTDTFATSPDGITWTGRGKTALTTQGNGVAWNGSILVAVGVGASDTIASSTDGITWTGRGNSIFSTAGQAVTWDGSNFIAAGQGTNTLATSSNGTAWSGKGATILTTVARGVSCTTPFASSFPAIGVVPTANTQYRIHDSFGIATSGTTTTLVDLTKKWKVNQWAGKRVIITSGTGYAQEFPVVSNTATSLVFAAITTAPDNTSTYTIIGRPVVSTGINLMWNFSTSDATTKGRTLIMARGGSVSSFDKYDIGKNVWTYGLFIQGQGELLDTGTMYAYDGDRIYFTTNSTGRVLYYDIVQNSIEGFGLVPYGMSTAILSNRMEIVVTTDGLKYLYIMRHGGTEMWRTIIMF